VPKNHNDHQTQPQQQQAPQTPKSGVRRSTRISKPLEQYSPSLHFVLLIDSGDLGGSTDTQRTMRAYESSKIKVFGLCSN